MEFGRTLDPIIKCFYFCGLSCYPSFDEFRNKKRSLVHYFPTGILIVLIILISGVICVNITADRLTRLLLLGLYMVNPILTMLVFTTQIICHSQYFAKICSQINAFERASRKKFSIDPEKFRRHFLRGVYFILITFLPQLLIGFSRPSHNLVIGCSVSTIRVFIILALTQTFFYIELLDYLLQCFIRHVEMRAATMQIPTNELSIVNIFPVEELKAEMNQYKLLHFSLYKLSRNINQLFGLTTFAVLLHNFLFTVYYLLRVVVQMYIPYDSFALRKSA